MLTKNDLLKIEQYLKKATVKDTEFTTIDKDDIDENTQLSVVHEGGNKIISLKEFFSSEVSKYLIEEAKQDFDTLKQNMQDTLNHLDGVIENIGEKTGVALEFGSSESVSVSQKYLTDTINRIWEVLGEKFGYNYLGFDVTVNKESFVSVGSRDIEITVTSESGTKFEQINIFENTIEDDHLCIHRENITTFSGTISVAKTTKFIIVAQILGKVYQKEKTITHYDAFWIGAGSGDGNNYLNVVSDSNSEANAKSLENGMAMEVEVQITSNAMKYIVVAMSEDVSNQFNRLDLNGIEIPLTRKIIQNKSITDESLKEKLGENNLVVYTSKNPYALDIYYINVNR